MPSPPWASPTGPPATGLTHFRSAQNRSSRNTALRLSHFCDQECIADDGLLISAVFPHSMG